MLCRTWTLAWCKKGDNDCVLNCRNYNTMGSNNFQNRIYFFCTYTVCHQILSQSLINTYKKVRSFYLVKPLELGMKIGIRVHKELGHVVSTIMHAAMQLKREKEWTDDV